MSQDSEAQDRDDAIERVRKAARKAFLDNALEAVVKLAREQATLTADQCWQYITETTPENRAMGAVMTKAESLGYIQNTGTTKPTLKEGSHRRPTTIWESLIHSQAQTQWNLVFGMIE